MKFRTILTLAVAALTLGVPVAAGDSDGYQPQLKAGVQPDAIDRYLRNNTPEEQPDAIARYLRNHTAEGSAVASTGAAGHPDSRAVRPSPTGEIESVATDGRDWETGAIGALGGALFAFLTVVGASAIRERRQLVLR